MVYSKPLTLNFFSLGFVQAINVVLQLIVIPFVVSIIGAEGFGIVAVAQVLMYFLSTFTEFGFNQTATRSIALAGDDRDEISRIFYRVYLTRIILCVIAFLVLLLLVSIVPIFRENRFLYLTGFAFVIGQTLMLNWFFQGLEKMWFIAIFTLLARVLFVVFIFLLLKNPGEGYYFLFLLGAGGIIAGIISFIFSVYRFKLRYHRPLAADISNELKEGWKFTLTNLSQNSCQYANLFILRLFTNDLVAGYFSIAEKIYFTAKQVLVIFSQSAYPAVCRLVENGKEQVRAFFKQNFIPFFIAVALGSALVFVLAPYILYFFSGEESVHSVFYLRMFSVAVLIICLNIPSTLILLARNQRKSYFRIYLWGGMINIVANILLAYFFQSTGTIAAIFITEVFITLGVFYEAKLIRSSLRSGNEII